MKKNKILHGQGKVTEFILSRGRLTYSRNVGKLEYNTADFFIREKSGNFEN